MRERLLANRRGKLHSDQWRELVMEPLITIMLLMVPAIILLRSFLLTLFVGGLWMVGVGALVVVTVMLFRRARRYSRVQIYSAVFRAPERLPSKWMIWKPIILTALDGQVFAIKHSLAPDKRFQANQEYLVYYIKSVDGLNLLSFSPTDHLDIDSWRPLKDLSKK